MYELTANNKKITYDIHGESGEYLLLLNGLMMTAQSWLPLMPTLKEHYQVICLNMHDMGSSEMMTGDYTNETQADAILALIEHLGIERINLCGTSYGGTVAIIFAIKYPGRIGRMMLFNSMGHTDTYLFELGRIWQKGAASHDVDTYYDTFAPSLYSPQFLEEHHESIYQRKEMLRSYPTEYFDSIIRLAKSAERFDCRDRLGEITAPTLIIGCDEDHVTPLAQQRYLAEHIPGAKFIIIPGGGHAVVYEKSDLIVMLMIGWFRDIETIPVF